MNKEERETVAKALDILRTELAAPGQAMNSPDVVGQYCQLQLAALEHEVFLVLYLNVRHQLIGDDQMFRGTIDGSAVYPREVAKAALLKNAAAVILAHNHPSGVLEPSMADQAITRRLRDALALLEIRVLDHLVVGRDGYTSMAERGLV